MQEVFEYDVFLSFASVDEDVVRPLWQELSLAGLRVFWSDAALKDRVGESWFDAIQHALERSRHCVLVCTDASMTSKWVAREYVAFYNHCYRPGTRRLIPLLAGGYSAARLPLFLRELEASRLEDAASLPTIVRLLGGTDVEQLRTALAAREQENRTLRETIERLRAEMDALRFRAAQITSPDSTIPEQRRDDDTSTPIAASAVEVASATRPERSGASDLTIAEAVRAAVDEIQAKKESSWGSSYMSDSNSRGIFGNLQRAFPRTARPVVVEALKSLLADPDALTRWKAMRLLTYFSLSDAAVVRGFWENEPDTLARSIVIDALKHLSEPEAFELLVDVAQLDTAARLRQEALKTFPLYFSASRRERTIQVLVDALTDAHEHVRMQALKDLLQFKGQEGVEPASRLLLRDDNNAVRVAAGELLAELGPVESVGLVTTAFERGLINDFVFRNCISRYLRRCDRATVLAQAAVIGSPETTALLQEMVSDATT